MRIIAGQFRHRTLLTNPGNTTRPITDRAKVILFDRIRSRLPGARVADFFSGTGTLGFEALSRGAVSVVFAERDHRAHELLRKNVAYLKVEDRTLCWRVDLARCSLKPKGDRDWAPYGAVFFDPPYAVAGDLAEGGTWHRCLVKLLRSDLTTDNAMLVVRVPIEMTIALPEQWKTDEVIEIASMRIIVAIKQASVDPQPSGDDEDVPDETSSSESDD